MKKLWYLAPLAPAILLVFAVSLFLDPWYEIWLIIGGTMLGVGALLGFIWLTFWLLDWTERKIRGW